ncbi:MAG: hypothetical protein M1828_002720 [Chrysothrix sp. TS-e1954]|nr:MAG: hypothetical protein M1828_002720 [Chrysothrix sp. TS-e1954]
MPGRKSGESVVEDGAGQKSAEKSKRAQEKDGLGVEAQIAHGNGSANDRAVLAGKKTIQPHDVIDALAELELGAFVPRCEGELEKYNSAQCDKRNDYRRRVREAEKAKQPEGSPKANGKARQNSENGDEETQLLSDGEQTNANEDGSADEQIRMEVDGQSRKRREGDEPSAAKRARMDADNEDDDDDEEMDDAENDEPAQDGDEDDEVSEDDDREADADDSSDRPDGVASEDEDSAQVRSRSGRGELGEVDDIDDEEESD